MLGKTLVLLYITLEKFRTDNIYNTNLTKEAKVPCKSFGHIE